MNYASGHPTKSADMLLYHLCSTFHCLPSELEREDAILMERLAYVDYVVQTQVKNQMRER